MNEIEAKAILAEMARRHSPTISQKKPGEILFDKQKAMRDDKADRKIAICSRRAGKTTSAADALISAAIKHPSAKCPYIALTRDSGKRIIWGMLEELLMRYNIPYKANEQSLTMTLKNRSEIFCYGADQKDLIKKLRGPKYAIAVIDECQSFRPSMLEELVDDVLDAGLADLEGQLWLLGTPGPICSGDFYDWSTGRRPGFSVHHWTLLDNPYINGKKIVEKILTRNKWTEDHPTFQREWLGRWVEDPDSLLFKFSYARNIFTDKPPIDDPMYIIGVDYGWHDETAFSVIMYSPYHPDAYVVLCEGFPQMTITETAAHIKKLQEKFRYPIIVADTGGLGKSITEELRARHGLNIKPAEKKEKATAIEVINDAFTQDRLYVYENLHDLIHQLQTVQRADNGLEVPGVPFDLADSTLYAFREAKHYIYEPPEEKLSIDSEEYMRRLEEQEAEKLESDPSETMEEEWWDDYG